MNALEPHFAIAASGTVEVLPFSPLLPSPAGVCGRKGEGYEPQVQLTQQVRPLGGPEPASAGPYPC